MAGDQIDSGHEVIKYSMEWEWNRDFNWTDKWGITYNSKDLYNEIKGDITSYMQKEEAKNSKLEENELMGLRLYTAPGFQPINTFLRALKPQKKEDDDSEDEVDSPSEVKKTNPLDDDQTWA